MKRQDMKMRGLATRAVMVGVVMAAGAAVCAAQTQEGCPVRITQAVYARHLAPLPLPDPNATTREKSYGTLTISFRNGSGKAVRSFHLEAEFAPDSRVRPPVLRSPDPYLEQFEHAEELEAGANSDANFEVAADAERLIFVSVTGVKFEDGTEWTGPAGVAGEAGVCTYRPVARMVPAR
jgi:hypothetical protein